MKSSRSLITWCLLTICMIFIYIYHQNEHFKNTYQRQRMEQKIQSTLKNIKELEQSIARQTMPDQIAQAAQALGMKKTKIAQLHYLKQAHE